MAQTLSIVDYIHELKEAGFTDKQAEVQAKRLELAVSEIQIKIKEDLKQQDFATRRDLEAAKNQIILWVVGIIAANSIFFLGILAKGFHWF